MLGRYERGSTGGEAKVEYGDGTMRVVKPGTYVRCAVTGEPIALDALRYWNVDRQEAYATPEAAMQRLKETGAAR
ncbi:DUF2093 domain-containing protein [Methylobacterium sp. J-043]|uniref:DUF2093 domain-containing protein n=1 Tax=Methylorubrum TaxID=2282523 RepID=UPI00209F40D9|nr:MULTISPECIES: DUF2093 domain-containing protein [Methylorubrum]MCJ2030315.1 DUF2093 domain-containing protein [Methylobacterium sp. J-043]MCP1548853.1 hypothetical protein [Methylorubrum zatmanii]MCP1554534.1 hypothetical protein [Methylorubrum extorquens]MCP1579156.1 hypothetical protein [Methylorubrum extorquens]